MFGGFEGYMGSSSELKEFLKMLGKRQTVYLLMPSDSDDGWSDDWTKPQKWGIKCSIKKLPVSQIDGRTNFTNEVERRKDESVLLVIEEIKGNPSEFFRTDKINVGGELLLDMFRVLQLTNKFNFEQMEKLFLGMNIHTVVDSTQQGINQTLDQLKGIFILLWIQLNNE